MAGVCQISHLSESPTELHQREGFFKTESDMLLALSTKLIAFLLASEPPVARLVAVPRKAIAHFERPCRGNADVSGRDRRLTLNTPNLRLSFALFISMGFALSFLPLMHNQRWMLISARTCQTALKKQPCNLRCAFATLLAWRRRKCSTSIEPTVAYENESVFMSGPVQQWPAITISACQAGRKVT